MDAVVIIAPISKSPLFSIVEWWCVHYGCDDSALPMLAVNWRRWVAADGVWRME